MSESLHGDILAFVAREFGDADLGDKRLRSRLLQIVGNLAEDPGRSIPKASGRWAATKGAYRFFANPRVTRESVMKEHWVQTAERIESQGEALIVEDTTFLNFSHHPATKGLGKIGNARASNPLQGVLVHSALAVDVLHHQVLGLIGQDVIIRKDYQAPEESRPERQARPRESQKWMNSARSVLERVGNPKSLIFTFDREGDVFEVLEELQGWPSRYVIRAAWNRRIESVEVSGAHLLDQVRKEPLLGEMTVEVPGKGGRKPRTARIGLRSGTYRIVPPQRMGSTQTVEVRVVCAREDTPPEGVEPLEWLLLTSEPVTTAEEVKAVVGHYTGRWKIEEWHKVLKTGCRIEDRELETWPRLDVLLGILSILAWRLLSLRDAARRTDCDPACYLSEPEQKILRAMDQKLPKVPTLRDYLRAIAKLGGFLARKGDGEPGWITLWQGFTRLRDLENGFRLAQAMGSG